MTPDEVIELRKLWGEYNYGRYLPSSTVLATRDWLAYVHAMAAALPDEALSMPKPEDVAWAWPDGVSIVFAEPFDVAHTIAHTIVSRDVLALDRRVVQQVEPHTEPQATAGLAVLAPQYGRAQMDDGTPRPDMPAYPVMWFGVEPSDVITASWVPDTILQPSSMGTISESSRLQLAMITALGHRLTRLDVAGATRGERRRVERELPGLRVLSLSSGASVQSHDESSSVEWSKRWMVRGHWRLQPYGPGKSLRKPLWIDPYVKGPEDKPLDVRPTLWRTNNPKGDR